MAVIASTLTTVAVFFPLVFVEGVAGQLFRDQALTVTIAMLISLVVAMTLIPMLSSLKAKAPQAFAPEGEHPQWRRDNKRRQGAWRPPAAASRPARRLGDLRRQLGGVHRPAAASARTGGSWLAQASAGRADRPTSGPPPCYHRMLPRALERPVLILGSAAARFLATIGSCRRSAST